MNITNWLSENKLAMSLAAAFLLLAGGLGCLTWWAWSDLEAATADYRSKEGDLGQLSKQKSFPSEANKKLLAETLAHRSAELETLRKELLQFRPAPFGEIEKAKPQDRPQRFQDALRGEVTRVKYLAAASEATLPPSFYLGLDEYENKPPLPDQVPALAKQLSVLSWLASTLVAGKGTIIAEFARAQPPPAKKEESSTRRLASNPQPSSAVSETVCGIRLTFRSSQTAFRELVNSISSAPYFLVIQSLQIQNSSTEPPRRTEVQPQTPDRAAETNSIQRLPIIVGRESLNISMKLGALEFPDAQPGSGTTK